MSIAQGDREIVMYYQVKITEDMVGDQNQKNILLDNIQILGLCDTI